MLYHVLKFAAWVMCRCWLFFKKKGQENIPKDGPAILVCNHTAIADVGCMMLMTKRKVYFMCKHELFENKITGWALGTIGSFPTDRNEGDVTSLRKALRVLKRGDLLCIYPEGSRNYQRATTPLLPLHGGVALLALLTGAPIIPMWINGNFSPAKPTRMICGPAVDLSAYPMEKKPGQESIDGVTEEIRKALMALSEKIDEV